jgi:hypothetical protein
MDRNNCVIIVEFGMQRQVKFRSGDDVCSWINIHQLNDTVEINVLFNRIKSMNSRVS